YWAGVAMGAARSALAAIEEETTTVSVAGRSMLLLRRDRRALERAKPSGSVRLLPNFDTYLLGHREKSLFLDAKHRKAVFRIAGWVSPVVLVGGRVAGTWKLERGELDVTPFGRLSKATWRAIRDEAATPSPAASRGAPARPRSGRRS